MGGHRPRRFRCVCVCVCVCVPLVSRTTPVNPCRTGVGGSGWSKHAPPPPPTSAGSITGSWASTSADSWQQQGPHEDWTCAQCSNLNYHWRHECNRSLCPSLLYLSVAASLPSLPLRHTHLSLSHGCGHAQQVPCPLSSWLSKAVGGKLLAATGVTPGLDL